jgi:hypothetical protein
MISLEDYEFLAFLREVPLWAGLTAGVLVAILVFLMGRRLRRLPRRRTVRPRNGMEVVLSGFATPSGKAVIVSRSQRGVALLMDQLAATGMVFSIHPAEAPESVPWVPVEVRHCRSTGKNWFIGCRFAEEVSWETKVWFGWQSELGKNGQSARGLPRT